MTTLPSLPNNDYPVFTGYPDMTTNVALGKRLHPLRFWSGVVLVAIVYMIPFAVVLLSDSIPAIVIIVSVFVIGGIQSIWDSHNRKSYRRAMERNPRTGWVDESGIHMRFPSGQTDLEWSHFSDCLELNDAIGLVKDNSLIDGYSSAMFGSPAEWERAKQMIQNGVKSR